MYAQHGHKLIGCKSLVGGSPLCKLYNILTITTSRRQGQNHEGLSGGSSSANLRADGQKRHIRLSLEASWHITTKPCDSRDRVNDAVVQRKFMKLSGEIC